MEDNKAKVDKTRRDFVRKAVYAAPAILTLSAMPFTASYGSQQISDAKTWDRTPRLDKPRESDQSSKWPDTRDKPLKWGRIHRNNQDK